METLQALTQYYGSYDEDNRLCSRYGMVEYLTTMRYIEKYLRPGMRILEIGAATGRYSHHLALQGYQVDAVELVEHNIEIFKQNTKPGEKITITQGNAKNLCGFSDNTYDITLLWSSIHTHIDYANGMWKPEVLEYVFSHAPQTEMPKTDEDGLITIYRGMGEMSQDPANAISWSTDPVCALWFANRSGRGTRLVSAKVKPEQILVYNPGYRAEHEIILKPGVRPIFQYADMIPSTEGHVPRLLAPVTKDFFRYGSIAVTLGYPKEGLFMYHGISHILRVLLLTLIYCEHSGVSLSEEDKQILIYFSLLHDIGRDSEDEDDTHGDKSVELIRKKNIRIKGIQLSKKGYRIAKLLIRHHCRDDETGIDRVTKVPNLTSRDIVRAHKLYCIAKDMDGLDRVRFNGLDFRQLRTPYARRLPLVAGGLLEEPLLECIENYRAGKLEVPDA